MKRFTKKLVYLMTALIFLVVLFIPSPTYAAEDISAETSDKEVLMPVDGFDYKGHTYVLFSKWVTWYDAKAFCEQYGGHLVCFETVEEQMAIMERGWEGWTGARLQGAGWTRDWVWDFDGSMLGTMHEPIPDVEGDQFYYTPSKPYLWDARLNEPNSWRYSFDQTVARLEASYGLNTLMPSDLGQIICEFDTLRSFVFVDNNYDRDDDYNTDKNFNTELLVNPDNYQVVGTYLIPRAIERDKVLNDQSLLKKQDFGKYPVHVDKHYNFLGWLYKTTDETLARWDYTNKDPITKNAPDNPIVVLYADWEDAGDFKQTDDAEGAAVYLALDQLVYLISDNEFFSSISYNGVSVGEFLNYCRGKEFDKLKPKLPLLVKSGDRKDDPNVINMLDYLYAKIGGWTILEWRAGERVEGGGWSFFAAAVTNNNGINAVIYEGTAFEPSAFGNDSFGTDAKFGIFGDFDNQFCYALEFFRDMRNKYGGETFATGHSLGGGLAAHAALTLDARAHTFNGVDGWTLPLTIRRNVYTHDFHGIDKLNSVDSWIQIADFLVGRHEYNNRTHHEISVPGTPNLLTAHLVSSCVMYADGSFIIAPSVYKPAPQKVWEIKNTYLGTSGNDTFRQPNPGVFNKPFFFGGDDDDVMRTDLATETGATFIPGAGNSTLHGDTGPNTYIIKRNMDGSVMIIDPYALWPNNRVELVNLRVTSIQEDVDMLLSDGRASKGVCITTDDRQRIWMDAGTLKNCDVFLVYAPDSVIWGAQPTFTKIYPLNGKWDKGTCAAMPTTSKVLLNGTNVSFEAYNISNNNFFKLRDLAFTLSDTAMQFEVSWDGEKNAIVLTSGKPYTATGGELAVGDRTDTSATPTSSKIYLDGKELNLTAYNIGGNNYFKLRDIGKALNFYVGWDGGANTITMDTTQSYSE